MSDDPGYDIYGHTDEDFELELLSDPRLSDDDIQSIIEDEGVEWA